MGSFPFIKQSAEGALLEIYVQPRASRNELAGIHEGTLKVRLTAPPVEGEANKECIKFLAKIINVSKSTIEILQGHKSRRKTLLFRGIPPEALEEIFVRKGML